MSRDVYDLSGGPAWIRPLAEALAEAGWHGAVDIEAVPQPGDEPRIHVRWNGRHVEAVSVEAAAEFIRRDAAAKVAEMNALDDANILGTHTDWSGCSCAACDGMEPPDPDADPEADDD